MDSIWKKLHMFITEFFPGWNLIGFPEGIASLVGTADTLGNEIIVKGDCTLVQAGMAMVMSHRIAMSLGNFPVEVGKGYFIYSNKSSIYQPNKGS